MSLGGIDRAATSRGGTVRVRDVLNPVPWGCAVVGGASASFLGVAPSLRRGFHALGAARVLSLAAGRLCFLLRGSDRQPSEVSALRGLEIGSPSETAADDRRGHAGDRRRLRAAPPAGEAGMTACLRVFAPADRRRQDVRDAIDRMPEIIDRHTFVGNAMCRAFGLGAENAGARLDAARPGLPGIVTEVDADHKSDRIPASVCRILIASGPVQIEVA